MPAPRHDLPVEDGPAPGTNRRMTVTLVVLLGGFVVNAALVIGGVISGWVAGAFVLGWLPAIGLPAMWFQARAEGNPFGVVWRRTMWPATDRPRRRVVVALVVLLLVAGCYAPPISHSALRRVIGAVSGTGLLVLSVAARRGWWVFSPVSGRALADPDMTTLGAFVGAVCLFAWATNIVG